MENIQLPEGYQTVMPYLIIRDAINFFAFTQTVFGGVEKNRTMRDDKNLMHGEVTIGGSTIMFAGCSDDYPVQNAGLYINVANADETYQKALAAGAESIMPPANQSYGRSGGVKDPFGNTWWITSAL